MATEQQIVFLKCTFHRNEINSKKKSHKLKSILEGNNNRK